MALSIPSEQVREGLREAAPPLLDIDGLRVSFTKEGRKLPVLNGVSFTAQPGETVAVVGESGSGKSVTALAIMGLLGGGKVDGGAIRFGGTDLRELRPKQMRALRGRDIAMIFQDPLAALDPLFTIGYQVREALRFGGYPKQNIRARAIELLGAVGIPDPAQRESAYPHELSGGQRQRVVIAIAIACEPKLIIADEPTTALDATIEGQILELIKTVQREVGSALLLITHDMSVVARMADRVLVMYSGKIVEEGPVREVLREPRHPYTAALLAAVPRGLDRSQPVPTIPGSIPSLTETTVGCRFAPRCAHVMELCRTEEPPSFPAGEARLSRCWLEDAGVQP
ncbi:MULTISPECIES: ABC transporter ATP-binding protein [unclassified Microbacterium]|uniref:ABC transporter ATP-binding protein n=1 Tax=unclassified Microbacterium TaxID=2609290 RepID=UPI00214B0B2B|nr:MULTISPECIES: ABC transporter ATP-binding protein [unclassified Microbacterium]MCR2808392.1 ABC transporter ATP-binding protein [Microbacterium sp. zg.B185]WIM19162.1 ABC transporter ATP-binding protein [Microbacterium sp. zg-B185]